MFWLFIISLLVAVIIQHLIFNYIIYPLFNELSKHPHGSIFTIPVVYLHEVVGHLIPAVLTGSRLKDADFESNKGKLQFSIPNNLFGAISTIIMSLGPTFIIPLLFLFLLIKFGSCGYSFSDLLPAYESLSELDYHSYLSSLFYFFKYLPIVINCSSFPLYSLPFFILTLIFIPAGASSRMDLKAPIFYLMGSPLLFIGVILSLLGVLFIISEMGLPVFTIFTILIHLSLITYILGVPILLISYYLLLNGKYLVLIIILSISLLLSGFSFYLSFILLFLFYLIFTRFHGS